MTNQITKQQIIARLRENDIPFEVVMLQDGIEILVCRRGGRLFGPFLSETGPSLYWVNPAFAGPGSFQEFLDSGDWNLGGERMWIAPEVQFLVKDRVDFWSSVHFPPAMDPGNWAMALEGKDRVRLAQDLHLEAYNLAGGTKELHLESLVRPASNPLRDLRAYGKLMEGVRFAGYEQVTTLREVTTDGIVAELWNLIQLNPGGVLVIPASPRAEYTDYFEPIDAAHQTIAEGHIRLHITGERHYKVGYKAAHLFGRAGYLNRLADGDSYLLVRNFFNNPSAGYAEEPAGVPGERGHSFHVYNDGGGFGGFGELECNGQTIGGDTGRTNSTDQMVLWLFVGAESKLREIGVQLLGVDPGTA